MSECAKKNNCCTCCPYGFHIDVDFLNSLERNKMFRKNSFGEQRNISEETHTQNLKGLMQGLCKYLDKIIMQPEGVPSKSRLTGLQPSQNGVDSSHPQTVPRTLHRQNLIKTCGLGQLSSKSFSEDENKFLRKHSNESFRNHSFQSEVVKHPNSDELLRIKSHVDNVLNRLQSLEDKEEIIKDLKMKIDLMKSERERLMMNLCNKCKILFKVKNVDAVEYPIESSKEQRLVHRSQSLKACRPAANQKSKIPSYIPGSPKISSIPTKSLETNQSMNIDHVSSKTIDQESDLITKSKISNFHRPRSVAVKVAPKPSVQANDSSFRSNTNLISSKISQHHLQRSSNKQLKTTNYSKVPSEVTEKSNPNVKIISAGKKLEKKDSRFVSMVTRSLDDSGSFMNETKLCDVINSRDVDGGGDDDGGGGDDDVKVDGEIVSGRKEERKICRRSLSLVTPKSQGHTKVQRIVMQCNSSSDEEMEEAVNGCNSDDDQSSTSFDEGSYDGELGQIIYKQKIENRSH